MSPQLPFEIVDEIVGYLDFEDVRSMAGVCSAFRLPAQLRLFRAIRIVSDAQKRCPDHTESILSTPHLLQCLSRLVVQCFDSRQTSFYSLWPRLPMMYHLSSMEISLGRNDCSSALSALESLGSEREIALILGRDLAPNLPISDKPLPVHSLDLYVDALNHQVVTRLVQKCSQSLRKLHLIPRDNKIPPLPFLSHLCEFSVHPSLGILDNDPDLMSWFPFLYQHPSITRTLLGCQFTLAVQPPPNLLPNLQFLSATPTIIERLIPGRPVNDIHVEYSSQGVDHFPGNIMLRSLRQSFVSVTTLAILTNVHLPHHDLINIIQALPKLRKFTFEWPCYQVSVTLQDLLASLGKCKDLFHIRLCPLAGIMVRPFWSREDFVQMVQRVQENGATGLWGFELDATWSFREGCEATRVGLLDVSWQPKLKGEWLFDMLGSSSASDVPISFEDAPAETEIVDTLV